MRITVFGSATPIPGEDLYEQSYALGELLAKSGYEVITGGYMGTMEAVSKGAAEAGAHVIGITCEEIEKWRPVKSNPWVKEELSTEYLTERLQLLTHLCDAAIALPGGIGTMVEICLTWNRLAIESLPPKPLILIGNGWRETFEAFYKSMDKFTTVENRQWLLFSEDIPEAVTLLNKLLIKPITESKNNHGR